SPRQQKRCGWIQWFRSTYCFLCTLRLAGAGCFARLFLDDGNALIENIHRDVRFIFGDDERRRDANRARATTQEEDAAFESEFDNAIAFLSAILFRDFVFDDFDADHQTSAADISHQTMFAR